MNTPHLRAPKGFLLGDAASERRDLVLGALKQSGDKRLLGSRAQAQWLWRTGLVALLHVESSRSWDQTCVPFIGGLILNHWTTREVFPLSINATNSNLYL